MNTIKNCHVQLQQTKPTTERQPHNYPAEETEDRQEQWICFAKILTELYTGL